MFEDALLESSGKIRRRSGWFSGVAAVFNCGIVCLLLALPLLHPTSLPKRTLDTLLAAPAAPIPPAPPVTHTANIVQLAAPLMNPFEPPQQIPDQVREGDREPSPGVMGSTSFDQQAGGLEELTDSIGAGTPPAVHLALQRKTAISSGVMAGRKLSGETPRYPAIAVAARVEGTVVLAATISKSGTIENLRVISGPALLVGAAVDAVRTWRYRPYLLNSEPVEVETTVNVVFQLGS